MGSMLNRISTDRLEGDEFAIWVCEGGPHGDHATLVRGWSAVVREFARCTVPFSADAGAIARAKASLLAQHDNWVFGESGTARLLVTFKNGWWSCTRLTATPAIDEIIEHLRLGRASRTSTTDIGSPPGRVAQSSQVGHAVER